MGLLTVDIGNTTISLGLFKGQRLLKVWRTETKFNLHRLRSGLRSLAQQIQKRGHPLEGVVICSVVPELSGVVGSTLGNFFHVKTSFIGRDLKVPLINRYRKPNQVGQDRLVCGFAASRLYGAPLIVIDFGTAITFDVVSRKKEYLGGIIVPGIRLTAESLWKKTALLPKVHIKAPQELIGRDTPNSILSGIFYGYGALCDGLIDRIAGKLKSKPKIILTGGYSRIMRKFISRHVDYVDEDLIFKGMNLIYSTSHKQ
jgi:type III pantothenate kinase